LIADSAKTWILRTSHVNEDVVPDYKNYFVPDQKFFNSGTWTRKEIKQAMIKALLRKVAT
jgi:hypothetical protein